MSKLSQSAWRRRVLQRRTARRKPSPLLDIFPGRSGLVTANNQEAAEKALQVFKRFIRNIPAASLSAYLYPAASLFAYLYYVSIWKIVILGVGVGVGVVLSLLPFSLIRWPIEERIELVSMSILSENPIEKIERTQPAKEAPQKEPAAKSKPSARKLSPPKVKLRSHPQTTTVHVAKLRVPKVNKAQEKKRKTNRTAKNTGNGRRAGRQNSTVRNTASRTFQEGNRTAKGSGEGGRRAGASETHTKRANFKRLRSVDAPGLQDIISLLRDKDRSPLKPGNKRSLSSGQIVIHITLKGIVKVSADENLIGNNKKLLEALRQALKELKKL